MGAERMVVRGPGRESAAVVADLLDRIALADAAERAPRLRALLYAAPGPRAPYPGWADLVSDLFCAHHGEREPELVPAERLRPSRRLNRAVMARLLAAPELAAARPYTRLDELQSALATLGAAATLDRTLAAEADRAAELERLEEELAERERGAEQARRSAEAVGDGDERDAAHEAFERAEAARDALGAEIEELAGAQIRASGDLLAAAERAGAEAAGRARLVARLPGLGAGERRRLPLERQLALAERWLGSPTLRRVAHLAGRLERDMRAARSRRVVGGRGAPVEVVLGDDLTRLLPAEQLALRVPALRRNALRRLGERRLLCWRTEGEERGARGPIVAVVDSSGSMEGARIEWAKAVCLALVGIAHRERRDAAVVEFANAGRVRSWELPHRRARPEDLAELASEHLGGGTDTATGIREALRIIERRPPFAAADLVLVTDGEDRFGDEDSSLRARLGAVGVRVQGVTVGRGPTAYTDAMCDAQCRVDELGAPSEATRQIARRLTRP